jgi:hypothetical protein
VDPATESSPRGERILGPVFHIELRQFPHVARSFNLSEEELVGQIAGPWTRGETVELGERRWAPERARLTVIRGEPLRDDEIGMGRGWSNATKGGTDVTESLLGALRAAEPGGSLGDFKREVLAQTAMGRIGLHQVVWLANARYPERRVSERLAVAEQAVWELLHEHRLSMRGAGDGVSGGEEPAVVPQPEWQATLFSWASWADPRAPSVLLERVPEGEGG